MKKVRYTNIYLSPYQWGPHRGAPTVYVELFGCNLTCNAINNPESSQELIETADGKYDRNSFTKGCSHRFSWHKDYLHVSHLASVDVIVDKIMYFVGKVGFFNRVPVNLCFTGGEPLLHQEAIQLIMQGIDRKCNVNNLTVPCRVIFETNMTQRLVPPFKSYLSKWADRYVESFRKSREVYFLNSPKLSVTGECPKKTYDPTIIADQLINGFSFNFIFPARYLQDDFMEIDNYMLRCASYLKELEDQMEEDNESCEDDTDYPRRLLSNPTYIYPVGVSAAVEQKFQHMAMLYGHLYCEHAKVAETYDCLS